MLKEAPIQQGNVVLGPDRAHAYARRDADTNITHFVFLIVEHVSILPLLFCVVVAIARVHETLDVITLSALEELVDSVLVVAVFELAASMKAGLWGYPAGTGNKGSVRHLVHEADEVQYVPYANLAPY